MAFPIINTRLRTLPGGAADRIIGGADVIAGGIRDHRARQLGIEDREDQQEHQTGLREGDRAHQTQLRKRDRAHQLMMDEGAHQRRLQELEQRLGFDREMAQFRATTQRQLTELQLRNQRDMHEDRMGLQRTELDRRLPPEGVEGAIDPLEVLTAVTGGEPFEADFHGEEFERALEMLGATPRRRLAMHPDDWDLITAPRGPQGAPAAETNAPDRRTPPPDTGGRAGALGGTPGAAPAGGAAESPISGRSPAPSGLPVEGVDPQEIAAELASFATNEAELEELIMDLPQELRIGVMLAIRELQAAQGGGR